MVKIRREGNKTTWLLEEDTLSGRLRELAVIFNHHSKESADDRMDPRFMAETLSMQAESLAEMARKQEEEIARLRRIENDLAELRTELKKSGRRRKACSTSPRCGHRHPAKNSAGFIPVNAAANEAFARRAFSKDHALRYSRAAARGADRPPAPERVARGPDRGAAVGAPMQAHGFHKTLR